MQNKSILLFIDWFLPGYKSGGPVTSNANMIRWLSSYINFKVVTRNSDYTEPEIIYPNILSDTWVSQDSFKCWYFSEKRLSVFSIYKILKNNYSEIIYINGIYSFYFSLLPLIISKWLSKEKIIVSPRGMLSQQALMVKSFKKKTFIFFVKFLGFYKNVAFHCTSEQEMKDVHTVLGKNKNVVFAQNFPKPISSVKNKYQKVPGKLKLTYLARISPEKNLLFILKLLSEIKEIEIQLEIYGSIYNHDYWNECKNIIKSIPSNIKVEYNNAISPDEVPGVLAETGFMVLPTTGENFGHSILESLSVGTPVLISDKTPWSFNMNRNNNVNAGWDISLDDKNSWLERIQYISLLDHDSYIKHSEAAYEFAKKFINDESVLKANLKMFSE